MIVLLNPNTRQTVLIIRVPVRMGPVRSVAVRGRGSRLQQLAKTVFRSAKPKT
jgi:hypothetical protein